jgi:putative ABC transport system ATP-binding protein
MLELEEVSKTYRRGTMEVHALRSTSLRVSEPGFTMIVGPSGSGKTTLLNLIGTLDRPSTGRIRIEGRDTSQMCDRKLTNFRAERIGFIFQSFSLMPVLSAFENVEYALLQTKLPAPERRRRCNEILEAVGLDKHRTHRPNELSGGQQQRVAIARALVKQPALVLADEPTANLDSANGTAVVQLMRDLQRRFATTFVFSTHDPMLLSHADQVLQTLDGVVTRRPQPAPLKVAGAA